MWQTSSKDLLCTLVTLNRGMDWLVITPDGLFDGTPAVFRLHQGALHFRITQTF